MKAKNFFYSISKIWLFLDASAVNTQSGKP